MALSLAEAYAAFTSPRWAELSAYLPSVLAMLAGNVLLLSSALVLSGLLILLIAILLLDGCNKFLTAWREPQAARLPPIVNGLIDFGCAALLWYLSRIIGIEQAVGIIVGAYIAAAGWRMLMAPAEDVVRRCRRDAAHRASRSRARPAAERDLRAAARRRPTAPPRRCVAPT